MPLPDTEVLSEHCSELREVASCLWWKGSEPAVSLRRVRKEGAQKLCTSQCGASRA